MLKIRSTLLILIIATVFMHTRPLAAQPTFVPFFSGWESGWIDHLRYHYDSYWYKTTGFNKDANFSTSFRADKVTFSNDRMILTLDRQGCCNGEPNCEDQCFGERFVSGEYATRKANNGYGTYTASLQAAEGCGLVTGFFVFYMTSTPDGKPDEWHEIDFEIRGKETNWVQTNYILKEQGKDLFQEPERHLLTFSDAKGKTEVIDASEGLHTYSFKWTPNAIQWFFDGRLIRTEDASEHKLPYKPGKIMANLWAGCTDTAGYFAPCGQPGCGSPICAFGDKASASFDFILFRAPLPKIIAAYQDLWTIW